MTKGEFCCGSFCFSKPNLTLVAFYSLVTTLGGDQPQRRIRQQQRRWLRAVGKLLGADRESPPGRGLVDNSCGGRRPCRATAVVAGLSLQGFGCGRRRHWRAATLAGIGRGVAVPRSLMAVAAGSHGCRRSWRVGLPQ